MKKLTIIVGFLLFTSMNLPIASAYSHDLSINDSNVRFSVSNFLEGRTVRIYASASNNSTEDLLGTVRFYDNGKQINGDQAISLFSQKTDDVFVDWVPGWGSHTISITIFPWDPDNDDASNNKISKTIYVQQDSDHDGTPNDQDDDDDGDGVNDNEDPFPLDGNEWADTDGDGTGDNADQDDDNDGVPDGQDDLPLDPTETTDTDGDGTGDIADTDDDNDGLPDNTETNGGTDPLDSDSDDDGTIDGADPFPMDGTEWADNDSDGIGNNSDIDDDNDGILDETDTFPLNKGPVLEINENAYTAPLGNDAIFDASDSYDEDGRIISYTWIIDKKYMKEGETITHKFYEPGEHTVKVTIKDSAGETRSSEFQVNVINIRLYSQICTIIITLLLAGILVYKYDLISRKSKSKKV